MQDHVEKVDNGELHWNGGSFLATAENAIERAVSRATIKLQGNVTEDINRESSPPASAPGEPPHVDTGTLGASIDHETYRTKADFIGRVGTNVKYGRWLEEGTTRMAPRPYLRPALDRIRPAFEKDLKAAGKRMERGSR
jgi:hypothetical protein